MPRAALQVQVVKEPGPQFTEYDPTAPTIENVVNPSQDQNWNPLLMNQDQIWDEMLRLTGEIDGAPVTFVESLVRDTTRNDAVRKQLQSLISIGKDLKHDDTTPIVTWYQSLADAAQKAAALTAVGLLVFLYVGYKRAINENANLGNALRVQTALLNSQRHDEKERLAAFQAYMQEFQDMKIAQDRNFFELMEQQLFGPRPARY